MTRFYNEQLHSDAVAENDRVLNELALLSTDLNDQYESDEWSGNRSAAKLIRYRRDQERHSQLSREARTLMASIEGYERLIPVDPVRNAGSMNDILSRWMRNGTNGISADEANLFITEPSAEMLELQPLAANGEVFDPFMMLADSPIAAHVMNAYAPRIFEPVRQPVSVRMAVGDPSRSDIDTASASGARDALGLAAPETWAAGLVERLLYYGAVARICHNFSTLTGNDIHQNQLDTTDQEGEGLYDQSQTEAQGVPTSDQQNLGNLTDIVWKSFWRTSRFIGARLESFTDIHFDVAGRITREASRRMGRGWNKWFTTGTGTNQPQGLVTSAKVIDGGAGSADDGTGGLSYKNLLSLIYGIDLAYLEGDEGGDGGFSDGHGGMIGWMLNRNIEFQLQLMTYPTSNQPVWVPSLERGAATQGSPGNIRGYPYAINQHMKDGKTADDIPITFGAFGHYGVRNIGGPMFYRFWDSRTARQMAVEFIAFSRRDGRCRGPLVSNKCDAYAGLQVKA